MTPERVAKIIGRRSGVKLSQKILESLAGAFAMDSSRIAWRALQELVVGDRSEELQTEGSAYTVQEGEELVQIQLRVPTGLDRQV